MNSLTDLIVSTKMSEEQRQTRVSVDNWTRMRVWVSESMLPLRYEKGSGEPGSTRRCNAMFATQRMSRPTVSKKQEAMKAPPLHIPSRSLSHPASTSVMRDTSTRTHAWRRNSHRLWLTALHNRVVVGEPTSRPFPWGRAVAHKKYDAKNGVAHNCVPAGMGKGVSKTSTAMIEYM